LEWNTQHEGKVRRGRYRERGKRGKGVKRGERKAVRNKSRSDSREFGPRGGKDEEEKGDDQIRLSSHDADFGCTGRWPKPLKVDRGSRCLLVLVMILFVRIFIRS
jgi:hypothetical protein